MHCNKLVLLSIIYFIMVQSVEVQQLILICQVDYKHILVVFFNYSNFTTFLNMDLFIIQ